MNVSFERKQQKEEWLTPKWIIDVLGPFDLDPCASIVRPWPTAKRHYTIRNNGLLKRWSGFVWCNPPYGSKTGRWLERMAEHGNGIALIFARTDTQCWHEWIFPKAYSILFLRGRLSFCDVKGKPSLNGSGSPSALIGYGHEATLRLGFARYAEQISGAFMCLR